MNWRLTLVFLIACRHPPISGDDHPDVGYDEDVRPNSLSETDRDVLDMDVETGREAPDVNIETNWDIRDINTDNYEDADWHPPSPLLETHPDQPPETPPPGHGGKAGVNVKSSSNRTVNRTFGSPSSQCGEYSSQLTSTGQCRLTATLPPVAVGTSQKRCPDVFRCTDDISNWLHENQNRKEQLDELRETMTELQEELRNHRHRVKALEIHVRTASCHDVHSVCHKLVLSYVYLLVTFWD